MRAFLIAAALLASPALAQPMPSVNIPQPKIVGGRLGNAYAPLIEELRRGGLVLLFRHDRTETIGLWDYEPIVDEQCDRQRNLSSVGQESARAIGATIRELGIPIGNVIASTFCRSIDTARLAFGGVHAKTRALFGIDSETRTLGDVSGDVLKLIAKYRKPDSNLVLVGHHGTIDAFTDRMLDEGDALILRPVRNGRAEIVAHMPAARWEEILRDGRRLEIEARTKKTAK